MTDVEPIIRLQGLTRRFGAVTAVDHVDLDVARGEIFGLVGPDGSGKTTILRILCGLMDPTDGSARVAGSDPAHEATAVKDQIGYMAQRFGLYGDLTVDENMEFYADLFGITESERNQLSPDLLRMTRMEPFRARPAGKLSGGMKQKLALMCTLLHRPKILFLDEPTNGVDPVSRRDFWLILYGLAKDGITIFVTTAYLDEAERCNRIGLMHNGRLILCDTPGAVKNSVEERCYEVAADKPREARRILTNSEGVASVETAGATLRMFLKPGANVSDLDRKLAEQGVKASFTPVEPSLEDVFIALMRRAEPRKANPS